MLNRICFRFFSYLFHRLNQPGTQMSARNVTAVAKLILTLHATYQFASLKLATNLAHLAMTTLTFLGNAVEHAFKLDATLLMKVEILNATR